jgi:shikimate kinase
VVAATGGGSFLGVMQRSFMKRSGLTVWLDVPLPRIRERLGAGALRPLWDATDPVSQRSFFEKRRAAYALAEVRVDASVGTPEEIASRIGSRLKTCRITFSR